MKRVNTKIKNTNDKLRMLLVNPSQRHVYGKKMMPAYPPLGLLYIGTVAEDEGHTVRLVDIDTEEIDGESFRKIFRDFNPDVVGLTGTTPTFPDALRWARVCKKLKKGVRVIAGGVHVTSAFQEVLRENVVDVVVLREGEETIKELLRVITSGKGLEKIKGIGFKKGRKIVINELRPLIEDMDTLPIPDRTLLVKPDRFSPPDALNLPAVNLMSSRGCPGGCTFCCAKNVFTRRFRFRSVAHMITEIEELVRDGVREIHIIDDAFTINKQRVLDFCREVKRRKITVSFQLINGVRADFVDRQILRALRSIGVKTIGYGVETGNLDILLKIKKGIPFEKTRRAYRLSKELGFETWAFLIFGLPGETDETARETIEFTKELDPDFAKFLILKPYPGSEVYAQLHGEGLLLSSNYADYGAYASPVHRLPGMTPERMVYWQKQAFKEFYFRPKKIWSHLKRVHSLTQLRLLVNDSLFGLYLMLRKN